MRKNWYTAREAASQLGVTAPTIRAWVRSGRLKGYVAGRITRVRPESLRGIVGDDVKPAAAPAESGAATEP